MQSFCKTLAISLFVSLSLAANAIAIPVTGDYVRMEADFSGSYPYSPYTMTDLSDNKSYTTFCLESGQHFYSSRTYYVESVEDYATGGGGGAVGGRDTVSEQSKWLYAAFTSGVFNNISNAANMVQSAIWWLEDEAGGQESDWHVLDDYYDTFDASGWTVKAVNIVQFYDGQTLDMQSQMVGVAPVPEPATMLLFGTGLVGLAGIGRRKFRKLSK